MIAKYYQNHNPTLTSVDNVGVFWDAIVSERRTVLAVSIQLGERGYEKRSDEIRTKRHFKTLQEMDATQAATFVTRQRRLRKLPPVCLRLRDELRLNCISDTTSHRHKLIYRRRLRVRSYRHEFCTSTGYLWISLVRAVSAQVVFYPTRTK